MRHKGSQSQNGFRLRRLLQVRRSVPGDRYAPGTSRPKDRSVKDRVAAEVKKFLGRNFKRIGRTLKVVEYAGKIRQSEGGDPAVVTLAAYLSAIAGGVSTGPERYAGRFSPEDVTEAQSVLSRAGAPEELTRTTLSILNNLGVRANRIIQSISSVSLTRSESRT